MKRISQSILVLLMALSIGLHWVVLQSVAWAGMFVDYAADHSFGVAIEKTFDVRNKCEMCKIVEQGTQEESEQLLKPLKLDVFSDAAITTIYPPASLTFAMLDHQQEIQRTDAQALPPPRLG